MATQIQQEFHFPFFLTQFFAQFTQNLTFFLFVLIISNWTKKFSFFPIISLLMSVVRNKARRSEREKKNSEWKIWIVMLNVIKLNFIWIRIVINDSEDFEMTTNKCKFHAMKCQLMLCISISLTLSDITFGKTMQARKQKDNLEYEK